VSEDAGIELSTVATLAVRRSDTWLDLILRARSHPLPVSSHPVLVRSHPLTVSSHPILARSQPSSPMFKTGLIDLANFFNTRNALL
jgi:hypothetical protein